MIKRLFVLFLSLLAAAPCLSFDRAHFRELNKKAREFAKQRDWPGMRQILIEIGKEMPALTPVYALRMASVETHLGNKLAALEWVKRYAAMGLTYDLASDDDLKPLLAEAGWKKIAAEMQQNASPVLHADPVCALPIADLMPEDLTFDNSSGSFIVSSIQRHSLYRVSLPRASSPQNDGRQACTLEELPLEAQAKRWPAMAVSFDAPRNLVWMTASAMPDFSGFPKEDEGKAALLAIDSHSGKVVRRFDLESSPPAVLGDMSISPDGTVYVSDSLGGRVFRVAGTPDRAGLDKAKLDKAKMEMIAEDLFSPQTPVLAADGKRLFVPEYPLGIAVIDLTGNGKITYLSHPENVAVTGIDGMHRVGDSLIGVQNGTEPERVVRFRLNHAQTEIEAAEVVEQSAPAMGEPTHAVAANGYVYVSANVGWDKIDDHGKLKEGASFTAPLLLRFPVNVFEQPGDASVYHRP